MISKRVLKHFGCTTARLREIFTEAPVRDMSMVAPPSEADDELRKKAQKDVTTRDNIKKILEDRVNDGLMFNLKNYRLMAAADLAWDWNPINKATIPLMLYAQGMVDVQKCVNQLQALPEATRFLKKDEKSGAMRLDLPVFVEVSCNLVRSMITRRHAAQSNKYANLWPYYKYESRSTGMVGKLRADAKSQRADIMADQFGHKHHDSQCMRDMLLYGKCVDFVRAPWEVDRHYIEEKRAPELSSEDMEAKPVSKIWREGVSFVNPHPSRVFWDNAHPLPSINSDSGCQWIGYWDVVRYRDIRHDPRYWNRDRISYSQPMVTLLTANSDYFSQYFTAVIPPTAADQNQFPSSVDVSAKNERVNNVGVYNGNMDDSSVCKTEFFWKLKPSEYGLGDYPEPVWTRWVLASDNTVLYAEYLSSSPAAYMGYNQCDNKQVSVSFAHELMPWQDQMSNLVTQMLKLAEQELFKIILLNLDMLSPEQAKEIRERMASQRWGGGPMVMEYAFGDLAELGVDLQAARIVHMNVSDSMSKIIRAMAELMQLCEKFANISPAEQGQPAPREISATEVNEMSATTASVFTFISDGIDEFHAAKKRILYESTICRQESDIQLPIVNRYTTKTIKQAGFEIVPETSEGGGADAQQRTVIGNVYNLTHDYIFTSRDGAERPINTQSANTLVQMLSAIVNIPGALQGLGKEKLYMIINEIFRMSGAGLDLNLEMAEGESDEIGEDTMQMIQTALQKLAEQVAQIAQTVQEHDQLLSQIQGLAEQVKENANQTLALRQQPALPGAA